MSHAQTEDDQSDALTRWLRRHSFTANPFAEWEAGKEEGLQRYFVSPPFFGKLYGNPQKPVTALLYAGRGCGKSAHRVIIRERSRPQNPHSTVLAVPYTDFTSFLNQSGTALAQPTLENHLQAILYQAILVLLDELTRRPEAWNDLPPEEQAELKRIALTYAADFFRPADIARWLALYTENKIPLQTLQSAVRRNALGALAKDYSLANSAGFAFWDSFLTVAPAAETFEDSFVAFRRLVHLVRAIGLDAMYILVDGVDEILPAAQPQTWADFVAPLLRALTVMEMPHVAFKFFLSTTVGAALKNKGIRLDRFHSFDLDWGTESLRELLGVRLGSFNRKGITSLKALAEEGFGSIDDDLIRGAKFLPRALILLGHLLFEAHCAGTDKPEVYLQRADLNAAQARFGREYRAVVSSVPLLRVDSKASKVLLGGNALEIKLSKREFKVLECLYLARGMLRSGEEIQQAIGGYVSNIAFDSMMSRLRDKLEPNSENSVYLITARGQGYRLNNTEQLE